MDHARVVTAEVPQFFPFRQCGTPATPGRSLSFSPISVRRIARVAHLDPFIGDAATVWSTDTAEGPSASGVIEDDTRTPCKPGVIVPIAKQTDKRRLVRFLFQRIGKRTGGQSVVF